MIVPTRLVIAVKISLFHLPRKAMWAISSAVKHTVMAMANFTPKTSLSLGGMTIICCFPLRLLYCIDFVKAFLIQSVMVSHLLLSCASGECAFSAHEETV